MIVKKLNKNSKRLDFSKLELYSIIIVLEKLTNTKTISITKTTQLTSCPFKEFVV